MTMMNPFDLTFPYMQGAAQVGELYCECTVNRDGSFDIAFCVAGTYDRKAQRYTRTVPIEDRALRSQVESYVVNRCAADLEDARAEMRRDLKVREPERV